MKYVLDSCVAFKWHLTEALSDKARQVRDDYRANLHELLAPDIFLLEIPHAITRAERQGRITKSEGARFLTDTFLVLPIIHPSRPLVPRAYEISSHSRVGFYDCLYVALAEQENCGLVTSDDRLVKNLQPQFPFIIPLALLP